VPVCLERLPGEWPKLAAWARSHPDELLLLVISPLGPTKREAIAAHWVIVEGEWKTPQKNYFDNDH